MNDNERFVKDMMDGVEYATRHVKALCKEFIRQAADPCMKQANVGDRVVVNAGLVNRGYLWLYLEAEVVAVSSGTYKLRFKEIGFNGKPDEAWVSRLAISDVLEHGE